MFIYQGKKMWIKKIGPNPPILKMTVIQILGQVIRILEHVIQILEHSVY